MGETLSSLIWGRQGWEEPRQSSWNRWETHQCWGGGLQGCGGESNKGKNEKERDILGKESGHKVESDPRAVWLQFMWELPAALPCSALKYCDRRVTRTLWLHVLLREAEVSTLPLSLEHTTNSAMLSWPASPLWLDVALVQCTEMSQAIQLRVRADSSTHILLLLTLQHILYLKKIEEIKTLSQWPDQHGQEQPDPVLDIHLRYSSRTEHHTYKAGEWLLEHFRSYRTESTPLSLLSMTPLPWFSRRILTFSCPWRKQTPRLWNSMHCAKIH